VTGRTQGNSGPLAPEIASVARGSVINLVAMVAGALLGFGLTVLVSRWLQPRGAGAFFELIALYTILSNTLELGADTGLLRWISRARAVGGICDVRRVVAIAVVPVLIIGAAAAAAVWVEAAAIARTFLHGMAPAAAVMDIRIVAPLLPLGALVAVLVSAARGFGRMWPFLAIQGLGQPAARLGCIAVALVLGWGLRGALIGWSIPIVIGATASSLILAVLIKREVPAERRRAARPRAIHASGRPFASKPDGRRGAAAQTRQPGREGGRHRSPHRRAARQQRLAAEFWRFTAPRGFSGTFQIVVTWLDILLVGALLSRYAAGVYGAVSKLALIGTFALEGSRLAIGPQLSALLARRQTARAARLHQNATGWLMIASWPFYILLSIFPVVVLSIFGHRYTSGASALVILALAMLINLGTGNVTVVLLMGGKSSLSAYNALAALIVNIGLNLLLLPHLGIAGAAIAWAASIVVDNIAPVIEVWLMLGIRPFGDGYWLVAGASAACFGITGIAIRALLGQSLLGLVVATVVGVMAFAAALYGARERLQLGGLLAIMRVKSARLGAESPDQQAA
jgi:O-antigen/teichoic acid export membrane protein